MALDLRSIAVNVKKASEGVWVKYLGAEFKVARYNNRSAEAARAQAMMLHYEKLREKMDSGEDFSEEDDQALHETNAKVMADEILLDWKGLTNDDSGNEFEYSKEAAFNLLKNLAYFDVYQFILNESIKHSNYAEKNEASITKDVKPSASSS